MKPTILKHAKILKSRGNLLKKLHRCPGFHNRFMCKNDVICFKPPCFRDHFVPMKGSEWQGGQIQLNGFFAFNSLQV